jgi:ribose transport system permease protein
VIGLGTTTVAGLRAAVPLSAVTVLAIVVACVALPAFRTPVGVGSLLAGLAPLLFVAVGQALVVLLSGIDLSVGAVAGLTTVLIATSGGWTGVLLAIAASAVVGAANGVGVVAGVHPLIMTLGTGGVIQGVALLVLPQPGGLVPDSVQGVLTIQFGPVPVMFLAALVALLVVWYVSGQTRFGRVLQASGHDLDTARRTGMPWRRVTVLAYLAAGLLAGCGGLAVVARIYSGDALAGTALVLDSITAVLVGGIVLTGGRGSVLAVLPAAGLLAVAGQVITLTGMDTNLQLVITGLVLIGAMLLHRTGGRRPG